MRGWLSLAIGSGVLLAACTDSRGPTQPSLPGTPRFSAQFDAQQGPRIHIMRPRGESHRRKPPPTPNTGIFYHGGPIIYFQRVAAIYWSAGTIYNGGPAPGTQGAGSADGSLVGFFLRNIGGSPYYNINTTYFDGTGTHVANSVTYAQYWADNSNAPGSGSAPSDADIQNELINALSNGHLAFDASTLYLVFSDAGVNLGGGFGTQYCAYHGHFSWNGNDVKYAAEPHDYDFPTACAALNGSPNNDAFADAEVNTIAHETEETNTDEDLNAWFDLFGNENADKCAWQFGTTYTTANNSTANMNIGGKDFLIQMNWVDASNSSNQPIGCRQAWP